MNMRIGRVLVMKIIMYSLCQFSWSFLGTVTGANNSDIIRYDEKNAFKILSKEELL
jgi:hypothetical protein